MSEREMTLKERVEAFRCLELPGQAQMMDLGTLYLVNDLYREVKRLKEKLKQIYECRYEFDKLFILASRAWDKGGENDI